MSSLVVVLALLTGLALAAAGLSFVALYRVTAVAASAERRLAALGQQLADTAHENQQKLDNLSAELRDLEQQPALSMAPSLPRAGFNLGKRTQALRMHRRGDSPEEIAVALEIPRQEVELLVKVHQIVLSNI